METVWFHWIMAVFATWRLAVLLVYDDGPWDSMVRLRSALGNGPFGRMFDCFRCVSLWVSAPLALVVGRDLLEFVLAWLSLSGTACLLERWSASPAPALTFQPWDEEGEANELLRKQTGHPSDLEN